MENCILTITPQQPHDFLDNREVNSCWKVSFPRICSDLSIKGVGVVTAASFLGEVGDLSRYDDWRQLRKMAGFNLTENSSGDSKKGKTGISKRGRPGLRCILYQASLTLVVTNPEFKALYRYLKTRRENPLKGKQALVVICCKLLRVMFTLAKENQTV